MARFYLADGSLADEDASGNVTIVHGPGGSAFVPDTTIITSFLVDTLSTISAAVRRDFGFAPAQPQAPAPASVNLAPLVKVGLIVGSGFLAYTLVKR